MFQKVLCVHSFRDDGAEARIKAAAGAPDLDGLDVRHICIIDRTRDPEATRKVDEIFDAPAAHGASSDRDDLLNQAMRALIKDAFLPALRAEIAAQGTDICLFHSGTVFTAQTGPLLQGTIDLGEEFPDVRWALEKQTAWLIRHSRDAGKLWGFAQKTAMAQARHVRDNFTTGPEVDRLLEAVYG